MPATFHGAGSATPIDVGVIGLGGQGQRNCARLWTAPDFRIAWVYDRQRDRTLGDAGVRRERSIEESLRHPPDVVAVATPPAAHFAVAERFLRAGIGVVLEKPTTVTHRETLRLLELAEKTGAFVLTNFNRRWDADAVVVREALARCDFGRVHEIESRVTDEYALGECYPRRKAWKLRGAGGGILLDWAPHLFDQLFELVPRPPESLYCVRARPNRLVDHRLEEQFTIQVAWPDCMATLSASWNAGLPRPRWLINGTRAALVVHAAGDSAAVVRMRRGDEVVTEPVAVEPPGADDELRALVRTALRMRETPPKEARRMALVSYAIDLARRSTDAGRPLPWRGAGG